ncbi:Asp-tRNA(Asn)/Glu-tRNA(Gln) amidotransferase subunit GatB [Oceanospirillum linum]|uniref:Aspartyl/glutamyl-tRNA(Asn/Gln) amidotransferase subunit B n=1 Tax=Oceanospirillum linum TaxID=966 RepID=A0A1T1H9H7_OCELI|nr:Asp-tRNA(Asn)/Glu-tRNA(Gln) amidotransferase subunit GatB [Oceanospirillum linum]OOV86465.1 aspartyl/glutamyl-tRNA amidotransferase subunit B [Oceanospirillum linum]SEG34282.1 aspartyl/glutamyl-tRNA(Asn/Gln) amidotransferase subunit B [Oleiphilus messinensis]SMP29443.1 aspartyl/glutamyl-tRNA(Asn/Gln) amidotransferase subunit B [Oceanospirillum linum]
MEWEAVIGLEIHVQLATQSKIFSGAGIAFGAEPNTQACAIDLGLPGILPVLNESAVEMAVKFGLGVEAEIGMKSVFERKNYFYPDLPKGYQTTQNDLPIVGKGVIEVEPEEGKIRQVRIHHAHLEEDAGKSLHETYTDENGRGMTGIDLNRAGTPLLEIVSEPDIRSAKEAIAYIKAIHSIVTYLGISDGNMAEGSMRCDANVSVRPKGQEEYGTRAEIKNINSFKFIEKAINHEIERQIELIEDGGRVIQETRLYDSEKNETRSMRSKEEANDYRYFPCPDLLPVELDEAYIEHIRSEMPELPKQKKQRFIDELGLSSYDAGVLSATRPMAEYFEQVKDRCGDAKLAANWVMGELAGQLNKDNLEIEQSPVSAVQLGDLVKRVMDDTINGKAAKQVFAALWAGEGASADEIIEAKGLKQVTDTGAIAAIVDEVMANNPQQVEQYQAAPEDKRGKMVGFFVGQVMKASKGTANPQMVNQLLKEKLG